MANEAAAISDIPAARPSMPSMRLTALVTPTIQTTDRGMQMASGKTCRWMPATTTAMALATCIPIFPYHGSRAISSNRPAAHIAVAPTPIVTIGPMEFTRSAYSSTTISPATNTAAHIARPPPVGIGFKWTLEPPVGGFATMP